MDAQFTFINKFSPNDRSCIAQHSHNCHELSFYDSGCSGVVTVNDKEYKFKAGDIVIVNSTESHSEKHLSNGKIIYFGFTCDKLNLKSGVYHNLWNIKTHIDTILKESIRQFFRYKDIISHEISEILIKAERSVNINSGNVRELIYTKNYIDENFMHDIKVGNLAELTGYSYDHFRHLFAKNFGISPQSYLIELRCEKAMELLKSTNMRCTDIAYQCGFSDSGQMTKMFKSRYSITPRQVIKEK